MEGYIHSVETFGTVDGPGIRYVLFLSGCNLQCIFCHNPDTWTRGNKTMTVEEVLADYERYRVFYDQSGGGITLSGGEPLLQAEFVAELFKCCRQRKIHTIVDSAGYCPQKNVKIVLPYVDKVLFCLKTAVPSKHHYLTGQDLQPVLENLKLLSASVPVIIRYVVIPGVNDLPEDVTAVSQILLSLPQIPPVELLPYHCLGIKKWDMLGKPYKLAGVRPAAQEDVVNFGTRLEQRGLEVLYMPKVS